MLILRVRQIAAPFWVKFRFAHQQSTNILWSVTKFLSVSASCLRGACSYMWSCRQAGSHAKRPASLLAATRCRAHETLTLRTDFKTETRAVFQQIRLRALIFFKAIFIIHCLPRTNFWLILLQVAVHIQLRGDSVILIRVWDVNVYC